MNAPEGSNRSPETIHSVSGEALSNAAIPSLVGMRQLAAMLRADAMLAIESGDGKRLLQDIHSTLGLSRQVGEGAPSLLMSLVSIATSYIALEQIEQALHEKPSVISNEDWIALSRQLSAPKVAADLITFQPERMQFDDMLQRAFTDDGSGSGRLTVEGVTSLVRFDRARSSWWDKAIAPAVGLLMPSRRKLRERYTHVLDLSEENLKLPLRDADWGRVQEARSFGEFYISSMMPAYRRTQGAAERYLGRRDGVVTAIALERFRQAHGKYPDNLNALVPELLPEVPVDRVTGTPVQYRLVDGEPFIYSVGANRRDDGGRYALWPEQAGFWEDVKENIPEGDWVLYPQSLLLRPQ